MYKKGTEMEEEYINIGKIDKNKFNEISNSIPTEEVVLTAERYNHILERHKEDFELYFSMAKEVIEEPDYILKDNKNENTAMVIKHIEETNINIIIRLAVENDDVHCKNSIMTFYRVRDKNLKKLIEKNKSVYNKE